MNRPLLGVLLGLVLGALDGSTAWFTAPELRPEVLGIVFGSCTKGLLVGLVTGFAVRKTGSLLRGLVVGTIVALAFTIPIAIMNANYYDNATYYWKIILPGAITGMLVGYATVRYGRRAQPRGA
ncbi:MAG: hypothetical protein R3B81_07615 [bacterium]|nr:hypothetical protein [Gemmatimonadota bacterium]